MYVCMACFKIFSEATGSGIGPKISPASWRPIGILSLHRYMPLHVLVGMSVCMYGVTYVITYVTVLRMYVCMSVCMSVCICLCVCMYLCMYTCVYLWTHESMCLNIHACVHVHLPCPHEKLESICVCVRARMHRQI